MKIASNSASCPPSRRQVLGYGAAIGGGLIVSGVVTGRQASAQSGFDLSKIPGQPAEAFQYWLKVASDNTVTVIMHMADMGQGVSTTLPQLVAEELEVPWNSVRFEFAPNGMAYINRGYGGPFENTGGSRSIPGAFGHLRETGAMAREMLRLAAAETWGIPLSRCRAQKGRITDSETGASLTYGELADAAAEQTPPDVPLLKPAADWTILGTSVPRLDVPAKTDGSAVFGMDIRIDGMLFAAIDHGPRVGSDVVALDKAPALGKPGVQAVVNLDHAVAVVADSYWQAKTALEALSPEWSDGSVAGYGDGDLRADLKANAARTDAPIAREAGDTDAVRLLADKVVTAEYDVPYLTHACMEPMNATVSVVGDQVDVYISTQSNTTIVDGISETLGIPKNGIRVHRTYLGGGLGRRGENDVAVEAARISAEVGKPVQLIWTREQDVANDFFRPAAAARFEAGLGEDGLPVFLDATASCQSIAARRFPQFVRNGMDNGSVSGLLDMPYDIANWRIRYALQDKGAPVGYWRSVGHSQNIFFRESFLNELAEEAGVDPLTYRRRLLNRDPRYAQLLDAVQDLSGWSDPLPDGRGRGVAVNNSHGSLCAQVVEVSLDNNELSVHRVSCVFDPGLALHPDLLMSQMEGSILDGLSAALFGGVYLEDGAIQQSNFHDIRFMKLADMPDIQIRLVEWPDSEPGGAGEPGVPPLAPALTGAIYAASGRRMRALPITANGISI